MKSQKILFITLSNIGDVVLTTPVLQHLLDRPDHPQISVLVGPKAAELFMGDPALHEVIIYDKHSSLRQKLSLIRKLRAKDFDEGVDLRHSLFPLLILGWRGLHPLIFGRLSVIPAKAGLCQQEQSIPLNACPPKADKIQKPGSNYYHAVERHLFRALGHVPSKITFRVHIPGQADRRTRELLGENSEPLIAIAPGAASDLKRWPLERYAQICRRITQQGLGRIVLIGGAEHRSLAEELLRRQVDCVDLIGKTNLSELSAVLQRCSLLLTNDSGPMHLAAAVGTPVVAVFGPSDFRRYGPYGDGHKIVRMDLPCSPCGQAQCPLGTHACMKDLSVDQVWNAVASTMQTFPPLLRGSTQQTFPPPLRGRVRVGGKILFVRTDRIGDVLVSTPALRALRKAYPDAWISVMVAPLARQAVELNPDVNEVLVYDKRASWRRQFQFWRILRAKKFDIAIIGHCTNPVNWLVFLAGIPERIGYARRAGYLLTRPLPNVKVTGQKHEADYMLDLVVLLGAQTQGRHPVFCFDQDDSRFAQTILHKMGLNERRPIVAVHAGSSSPSKRWPPEYFTALIRRVAARDDLRILLVGGPGEIERSRSLIPAGMENCVADCTGLLNLRELGAVLSRCALLISNDCGPVHVAVGIGTPVLAIFGRNRPGLGPKSWGPLGPQDQVIQKDVGCTECLADACKIDFKCLRELSVEEVYAAACNQLAGIKTTQPAPALIPQLS